MVWDSLGLKYDTCFAYTGYHSLKLKHSSKNSTISTRCGSDIYSLGGKSAVGACESGSVAFLTERWVLVGIPVAMPGSPIYLPYPECVNAFPSEKKKKNLIKIHSAV